MLDVGSLTHADICELRAVHDSVAAHNAYLSEQLPECLVKLDMDAGGSRFCASRFRASRFTHSWILCISFLHKLLADCSVTRSRAPAQP